jgi:hypothetical protein
MKTGYKKGIIDQLNKFLDGKGMNKYVNYR